MADLSSILDVLIPDVKPVSFETFVRDEEYCGDPDIYDYWVENGENLEDPHEIILDGSLGGGKSTFASVWIAYQLYKLFLLPDLHKTLGVRRGDPIYVLYFSTSLKQAQRSGFKYILNTIDRCKWFSEHFPRNKNKESSIEFSNQVSIEYASSEGHQIGLNVIGFILDEANFRNGLGTGMVEEYEEVTRLYTQLIARQINRFQRPDGHRRSFAILVSSASYQSSFVEQRKKITKNDPYSVCITSVSYKVKPWLYSAETFEVFIGTGTISPQIIESDAQKETIIKKLDMQGLPDQYGQFFVDVPLSLKPEYEVNTPLALQNHSGVPTQISGRFVQNFEIIRHAYYKLDPSKRWFPSDQIILSNQDDFQLMDVLDLDAIEYPERPHAFHLDMSVTGDSGGFSCYRNDSIDDRKFYNHVFTLEIVPPGFPAETLIDKWETFLIALAEIVNVAVVSSDQYASKQLRQNVNLALGLDDTRFSIDSSDEFFLHWMRGLVAKQANLLYIPKLQKEIQEAEHDLKHRRVVKPKHSTDDLFQSLVGAYFGCSIFTENVSITDLYKGSNVNLVGGNSVRKVLKYLGYK